MRVIYAGTRLYTLTRANCHLLKIRADRTCFMNVDLDGIGLHYGVVPFPDFRYGPVWLKCYAGTGNGKPLVVPTALYQISLSFAPFALGFLIFIVIVSRRADNVRDD